MSDWSRHALCADLSEADADILFFPDSIDGPAADHAIAICHQCPVRAECLDDAMRVEGGCRISSRWGIRGGLRPVARWSRHKRAQERQAREVTA